MKKIFTTFCAGVLLVTLTPFAKAEAATNDKGIEQSVIYNNSFLNWNEMIKNINVDSFKWTNKNDSVKVSNEEISKKETVQQQVKKQEVKTEQNEAKPVENKATTPEVTTKTEEQPKVETPVTETPKQEAPVVEQPKEEVKTNETTTSSDIDVIEAKVVELTNAERAKHGLKALVMDQPLMAAAREKSQDMKNNNYFSHTSPTFGSPFDRMKALGIAYKSAGENIAKGQQTPEQVVEAWMNSEGHRANILDANYTHIGVGYVKDGHIWTQQFIKK